MSAEIVYLNIERTLSMSLQDLQKVYNKDIDFDLEYTLKYDNTVFKIDITKLANPDKLKWILNVKDVINYSKTYIEIEKVHLTPNLKNEVDAKIVSANINPISYKDFEDELGGFENYNYDCYVHFSLDNLVLNNIKLITTDDLILNNSNFTEKDFFFSVPFFKSFKNGINQPPIDFYFVEVGNVPNKTLALKAYYKNFKTSKYYDISYNPPGIGSASVISILAFKKLELN